MKEISLYIHIPFCKSKCSYCNFCVIPGFNNIETWKNQYIKALTKEINGKKEIIGSRKIKTIYLGGGTPSELGLGRTKELVLFLQENFDLKNLQEFSIEINPDLDEDLIEYMQNLQSMIKTNLRFSFGIQSLDNKVLKYAGRNYNLDYIESFLKGISKIKKDNNIYNLDFISFGIESLDKMDQLLGKYNTIIDSLSIYTLELFPGSVWYDTYKSDEDKIMKNFDIYLDLAQKYGYERYEISNFAKKGKHSIHNNVYWNMNDYLGFGISGSSFLDGKRFTNSSNFQDYISGNIEKVEMVELSPKDIDTETIFLGLRTTKGINYNLMKKNSNQDKLKDFIEKGYLKREGNNIVFTNKGFDLYNHIITELLEFD